MPVNDYNIDRLTGRICEAFLSCEDCPLYPHKYPTKEREEYGDPVFWCDDVPSKVAEIAATIAFQDLLKKHPELRKNFTEKDIYDIGMAKGKIV